MIFPNTEDVLLDAIRSANIRADRAYEQWDSEAFEGACNSGNRAFQQLIGLVGEAKARQLTGNDTVLNPARIG